MEQSNTPDKPDTGDGIRNHVNIVVTEKYSGMQSTRLGKISFLLAVSPWFLILPGYMSIPGFG